MKLIKFIILSCFICFSSSVIASSEVKDSYLWLEQIESERTFNWVKKENKQTLEHLFKKKTSNAVEESILSILESDQKLTYPKLMGDHIYNFWRDKNHPKGIWRRKSLKRFSNQKGEWEIVLDLDKLGQQENKNWVFKGSKCLEPSYDKCLIYLSDGGKDAVEIREMDMQKKIFISSKQNGFFLPEAKTNLAWKDKDTLYVATNFGKNSTTDSGYPRFLKILKRGQNLTKAQRIFVTSEKNMSISPVSGKYQKGSQGIKSLDLVVEMLNFYSANHYVLTEPNQLKKLNLPQSVRYRGVYQGYALFYFLKDETLNSKKFDQGSVWAFKFDDNGKVNHTINVFQPAYFGQKYAKKSFSSLMVAADRLILSYKNDLEFNIEEVHISGDKISSRKKIPLPKREATIRLVEGHFLSKNYFFTAENMNLPTTLYMAQSGGKSAYEKIQTMPDFFNSNKLKIKRMMVTSKDGTKVPFYIVSVGKLKKDAKNKALLTGYGGFNVSMQMRYNPIIGKHWLKEGQVYVLANIRGGGEYGPAWHQVAIKANKQKSYEDFIAVSEKLIKEKITSSKKLAIIGGSNGGLLVGAVSMQRPDLYGAVVSLVPLLDMKRYHRLLAGASWMSEYGNPDEDKEWSYIKRYSPYHNIEKNKSYPQFLFYTSTKDDRVHPGHARKMAHKMKTLGIPEVYLFENQEGGHGGSSSLKEQAKQWSMIFKFLEKGLD